MIRSLSALLGLFLCATGALFFAKPEFAVSLFGVDSSHMADLPLAGAIGARQLALGLAIVALALRGENKSLGMLLIIGSLVPVVDGYIASGEQGMAAGLRNWATAPVSLLLGIILSISKVRAET